MPGMMKGSMYKKGGAVKKGAMKFQVGGPVKEPATKTPRMEGGYKNVPTMTPEQLRQAREAMTPAERRDYQRGSTADEARRMREEMKKGGMVKKKAGGMIKKAKGGMIGGGCK